MIFTLLFLVTLTFDL